MSRGWLLICFLTDVTCSAVAVKYMLSHLLPAALTPAPGAVQMTAVCGQFLVLVLEGFSSLQFSLNHRGTALCSKPREQLPCVAVAVSRSLLSLVARLTVLQLTVSEIAMLVPPVTTLAVPLV